MLTERLEIRPTIPADRDVFVQLFCDEEFMVFAGSLTEAAARTRFDHMLAMLDRYPFAKQTIIERSTGQIIGYTGVDETDFEGERRLEFGWRLVPQARGRGYATEAASALLDLADQTSDVEILAFVDPRNAASQSVAKKMGFAFSRQGTIDDYIDNVYVRGLGTRPTAHPQPGELTIALASADDIDDLANLRASWVHQSETTADLAFQTSFRSWFETESNHRQFWISRVDGQPAGMVNVLVFDRMPSPTAEPGRWGYLGNMYVQPSLRNQSLGFQLLNAVTEWADEQELVRLVLNPSERSIPFYTRHGFTDRSGLLTRRRPGAS